VHGDSSRKAIAYLPDSSPTHMSRRLTRVSCRRWGKFLCQIENFRCRPKSRLRRCLACRHALLARVGVAKNENTADNRRPGALILAVRHFDCREEMDDVGETTWACGRVPRVRRTRRTHTGRPVVAHAGTGAPEYRRTCGTRNGHRRTAPQMQRSPNGC